MSDVQETFVPHVGWLRHESRDDVATYLRQGWFEYLEQAFLWLYLRPGDVMVDCGAHVGLYSLLAANAMAERGVVIAIEPNPPTLSLLRTNLDLNSVTCVKVVEGAAFSVEGAMTLHAGSGETSAYSSLLVPVKGGRDVAVRTFTLDGLLNELHVDRVDFLKVDVEGAEREMWKGCARSAESDRLSLVMVEFTESIQQAMGGSTADLVAAWASAGYRFYRFDGESLRLKPAVIDGPIEYENLFAARDVDAVNRRLRDAARESQRIAQEILNRGRTAFALLKRACDAEHFYSLVSNRIPELQARTAAAERRAAEVEGQGNPQGRMLAAVKRTAGWFLDPGLGNLRQYAPRPLRVPARYRRTHSSGSCPVISIVTPTFNSAQFLERTVRSAMDQAYEGLEYIVQDGGSTDETLALLGPYRARIAWVGTRKDNGQADALNSGFRRATGEILAYLNSDDLLLPGALHYVAQFLLRHPDVDVVYGHRVVINEYDEEIARWVLPPHDDNILEWADYVPQETLFWRRGIWERVGARLDESFQFAMDWDLLLRFREAGARFARAPRFLGAFRVHASQKTSTQLNGVGTQEMTRLRERVHGRPVSRAAIYRHVGPYLRRHLIYHHLYRLGLLRY